MNCWPIIAVVAFVLLADVSSGSISGFWNFNCVGGNYSVQSQYQRSLTTAAAKIQRKLASSAALFAIETAGTNRRRQSMLLLIVVGIPIHLPARNAVPRVS